MTDSLLLNRIPIWVCTTLLLSGLGTSAPAAQTLPGTTPLTEHPDRAAEMVEGLRRYLERATVETARERPEFWTGDGPLPGRFESNRVRLRDVVGLNDPRDLRDGVTLREIMPVRGPGLPPGGEVGRGAGFRAFAVAWTVFRGVEGEGLLLVPDGRSLADVVVVPDCEQSPEQLAGLVAGLTPAEQVARRCAEAGCRVIVPALIGRDTRLGGNPGVRSVAHSARETLWRAGYEMGHTPVTYEVHRLLAAADWFRATRTQTPATPMGVAGYGEGGRLALFAAAVDPRFDAAWISGAFGPREALWEEPIDRNLFGLLREFGDAEVAALIAPRPLFVESGRHPEVTLTDAHGGAPGRLARPEPEAVRAEFARLRSWTGGTSAQWFPGGGDTFGEGVDAFLKSLGSQPRPVADTPSPEVTGEIPDAAGRTLRLYRQLLEDTQWLMREGEYARRDFWKDADFRNAAAFEGSAKRYREYFRDQVVGRLPPPSLPMNPRARWLGETNGVVRYEVVLDVHPDVMAFGILCLPAGLKPGERRPVVVCQHGLEGRPSDISDPAIASPFYHQYGLRLAERGFITFAPQNPYIGGTRFRQVLRQAQPLGLTLWSFVVRQHEVITEWLAAQPFTDPDRIAFYGLSYGGKTAMRVPVLVDRYCLSICSADYNEWIWKNVSARSPYSYLWTPEYDMPEWNLGNTFNYAEMSWLIFPRPFMVERGHDDGVAPDEWVAYEFAKTRRHYVKLGHPDRAVIEYFDGPHSIYGRGTFEFLHRHLRWPAASGN
ncbi:MAG: dienelactone hydrolase family protein [Verrucomicrobiae bacterium]|nr:dienelactone hydrolase family protein [Verrucomicrobiae bacterium]